MKSFIFFFFDVIFLFDTIEFIFIDIDVHLGIILSPPDVTLFYAQAYLVKLPFRWVSRGFLDNKRKAILNPEKEKGWCWKVKEVPRKSG
jgi:hypothetical protein